MYSTNRYIYTRCLFRVIVQYIPSFSGESEFVQWHIPSKFSEQMRKKSVVVSFLCC